MPLVYHEGEHVTGATNDTTYGENIVSTEEEQKTILEVSFAVSAHDDDCLIIGKIDREEFVQIPVNMLPVFDGSGGTNTFQSSSQRLVFEVDHDLAVGEKLKFGVLCEGTAVDFAYSYSFRLR